VPADAAPTMSASCTVTGEATTSPPVQLMGGTGNYSFDNQVAGSTNLQFNCLGASASGGVDVEQLQVTSTGTYNNTVCGTGSADGTNTGIAGTSLGLPGTTNLSANWAGKDLSYHIDFVGGQGVLSLKDPENPAHPGTSDATGGGDVTIVLEPPPPLPPPPRCDDFPPPLSPPPGCDCSNGFSVAGSLVTLF
jgi:hypothetical protein